MVLGQPADGDHHLGQQVLMLAVGMLAQKFIDGAVALD
jgi:hypothetical protein